jgi:hypothetical protein
MGENQNVANTPSKFACLAPENLQFSLRNAANSMQMRDFSTKNAANSKQIRYFGSEI